MLEVRNIHKTYEGKPLLNGISFTVASHELVCLLGSSGSGKSTLLRIIAGMEEPEQGSVWWNGADLAGVPTHQRGFGLMFQDYALFPHLTVAQNIAYGLKIQALPPTEIDSRVREALHTIRMEDFASRPVTELSGGEQQRVALARALAPRPRLLMLDEPLGALDHSLRVRLIEELRLLLRESKVPVIYVTHDREEAFSLADRLLLLHEGRLLQQGSPRDLFLRPANSWAAEFLGLGNRVSGQVGPEGGTVLTPWGVFACESGSKLPGSPAILLLRAEDARVSAQATGANNTITGQVRDCVFLGEHFRLELEAEGLLLQVYSQEIIQPGSTVSAYWPAENVLLLSE